MNLTPNKRIIVNILATYGRNAFCIFCSLLTGGWVFVALGEVDYGLMSTVGGLTACVVFLNGIFSGAVSRFYALAVGEARNNKDIGLETCRRWFNTALTIHFFLPCSLIIIGYPLGVYAINHWLTIPTNRLNASLWIWSFSCFSCWISMICVPFQAMYYAKQYIAELTIYSFATTIAQLIFVSYMHYNTGDWLIKYSLWQMILSILPQIVIAFRAYQLFPECRIEKKYLFCKKSLKSILSYTTYNSIGCVCGLLRTHGYTILTNVYFGPAVTAAMSISKNIEGNTLMFSLNVKGALSPAITNAYGAGDYKLMRRLAHALNKFGGLLMLFLALPIILELPFILKIWLKNPPAYTYGLTVIAVASELIYFISNGQIIALNASGKIKLYYIIMGGISLLTLPLAWVWVHYYNGGVYGMQFILFTMLVVIALGRVVWGSIITGISAKYWFFRILLPLVFVTFVVCILGYLPHFFFSESILRIFITGGITEFSLLFFSWFFIFDSEEKIMILSKLKNIWYKLKKRNNTIN